MALRGVLIYGSGDHVVHLLVAKSYDTEIETFGSIADVLVVLMILIILDN